MINEVDTAVTQINARLNAQGRDQAVMADFIFTRMSPSEKVKALEGGFRAEAFVCVDGSTDCEQKKAKDLLLERYRAEARTVEIASRIQSTAGALSDLNQIAQNLNINLPGLDRAAQYASVASQAATQFASGNYLGAAVAISGVFGKRSNPDQARFAAIMRQLGVIDEKLGRVLQNQQALMNAVGALSAQMTATYQALDERLALIDFETKKISTMVQEKAWEPWQGCFVFHGYSLTEKLYDPAAGQFTSLDALYSAVGAKGAAAVSCLDTAQSALMSPVGVDYFGNFLSIERVKNLPPGDFERDAVENPKAYFRPSDLAWYETEIHRPSVFLLANWADGQKLSWANVFVSLAFPKPRIDSPRPLLKTYMTERGARLLEFGGRDASETAFGLLETPMLPQGAIQIAEWLSVASRAADIRDLQAARYIDRSELLSYARKMPNSPSPGEVQDS